MRLAPLVLAAALAAAAPHAQPVVDGDLTDAAYTFLDDDTGGAATGFGVPTNGQNGSILTAAYAYADPATETLYLGFGGTTEANFNKLLVFLDTRPGGFNTATYGDGAGSFGCFNAFTDPTDPTAFDAGFEPDFGLEITRGDAGDGDPAPDVFANIGEFLAGSSANYFVHNDGAAVPVDIAFGALPDQTGLAPGMTTTDVGIEVSIPYSTISASAAEPLVISNATIGIFPVITSSGCDFLSNQTLSPLASGQGNLGSPVALDFGTLAADPLSYAVPTLAVTTSALAGYRMLSVPETARTVEQLAEVNLVSGAGGFTQGDAECATVTNLFTSYSGDPSGPNGGYGAPAAGESVEPGEGFFWYFFGDASSDPQPFPDACSNGTAASARAALPLALPVSGTAPSADVVRSFTTGADGYLMAGNPFGVAFDIDGLSVAAATARAGAVSTQASVQIWEPDGSLNGGTYEVVTSDGVDLSAADGDDVSAWQGFFVETTANAAVDVTYDDAAAQADVDGDGFVGRQAASAAGAPLVQFRVAGGGLTGAAAVVRFHADADEGWDRFDLSKLAPFSDRYAQVGPVGTLKDGTSTGVKAVESRPLAGGEVSVPLAFATSEAAGTFTLSWPSVVLADGQTMTLRDLVTGQAVDLATATELTFAHDASAPAERFELTTSLVSVADEAAPAGGAVVAPPRPNPTSGRATLRVSVDRPQAVRVEAFDLLGRRVATVFSGVVDGERAVAVDASAFAPGAYVLRTTGETFAASHRLVVGR